MAALKLALIATVCQATGCTFDPQTFFNEGFTTLYNNVTTLFIVNTLSDLLHVSPNLSF